MKSFYVDISKQSDKEIKELYAGFLHVQAATYQVAAKDVIDFNSELTSDEIEALGGDL